MNNWPFRDFVRSHQHSTATTWVYDFSDHNVVNDFKSGYDGFQVVDVY